MRLVFDMDGRYDRAPDGSIWVKSGSTYKYWTRFLGIFDSVCLVGRARDVSEVSSEMQRVDGDRVSFAGVPYYHGPWQYLMKAGQVKKSARGIVTYGDALMLGSGPISAAIEASIRKVGYPYAMWVIGDPYDTFAPGATSNPLAPLFRWWFPREQRRLCAGAFAAAYVTNETLQQRYPCRGRSVAVTDVDLPDEAFAEKPRTPRADGGAIVLLMVGTLAQLYKAPNVLIDAVVECVKNGLDLKLRLVGDGKHKSELVAQAKKLDISERVEFLGQIAREEVPLKLDQADLFVLPSYQEGLPRAMIEAMAKALPCIGSTVGGIPELLPAEDMVPPGDAHALAEKIREVACDPERMARMSARNLEKAREYHKSVLWGKWIEFYQYLREGTEQWMKTNSV